MLIMPIMLYDFDSLQHFTRTSVTVNWGHPGSMI
jgi:hypothetical protein